MTAAAISAVLGGDHFLKLKVDSDAELTRLTREGLPVNALTLLAQNLSIDRKVLARLAGISDRTLSRRIAGAALLSAEESDRLMRMARVAAKAIDTFGTSEKAARWLRQPNRALAGDVPLDLLDTDSGVRQVETILGRIDYGLYS